MPSGSHLQGWEWMRDQGLVDTARPSTNIPQTQKNLIEVVGDEKRIQKKSLSHSFLSKRLVGWEVPVVVH